MKRLPLTRLETGFRVLSVVVILATSLLRTNPASAALVLQVSPSRGDVDGNGAVDLEDARLVTQYVTGEVDTLPYPENADATQDGQITIEDALAIAQRVTGHSLVVTATSEYGVPGKTYAGSLIRIEAFERFFPFHVTGGTVRIQSASTGYDSGDQPLTFEWHGRSLYYHWDTMGLSPASDYEIYVELMELDSAQGQSTAAQSDSATSQPRAQLSLDIHPFELTHLAQSRDAYAPATGMPLEFLRVFPSNSTNAPYLGPLGRGWVHNFDIHLEEFTDGRIAFVGPNGFNRWFESNADGTYTAPPGDYGVLTRDPDGTFQLEEKSGFIYCFRSDLRLDYMQDLNGNSITAIYNAENQLVEIQHSCGQTFYLEYNAHGHLSLLRDHVGRETTYSYDESGEHLISVVDPASQVISYTYSIGQGEATDHRLLSVEYPDGTHVYYTYDSEGRVTSVHGDGTVGRIDFSYDDDGTTYVTDVVSGTVTIQVNDRGQPTLIIDPNGGQSRMAYDASANLTAMTDPLTRTTHFEYDQTGNVVAHTNPLSETVQFAYDPRFNKPISITDSLGHTTVFEYDSSGNLLRTTYPDTSQENYTYDATGNLISFTDALSKTTYYSYTSQGQITSLQDSLGHDTQFSYDAAGDLKTVTDARGHVTTYTRDTLGRTTRITYPDGSHEDYEYDAAGKTTAFTNRRGERMTFSYDADGRLEWKECPSGKKLKSNYDLRGILSSVYVVSGETSVLDVRYDHDLSRRPVFARVPGKVATESYDVSYAYDAAGNRRFMAYPDGYAMTYEYDAANRLKRIGDGDLLVAYEYDDAGRRTRRTLGNGTYTTYEYDDLNRLTRLVNYAPDDSVQSQFEYTYNAAGMRTSMTTLEGVHTYTYDDVYQLTRVEYPDGRVVEYAFDAVGNRTVVTDTGVVTGYVTNALDQYTQVGTDTFGYDANGNLITRTLGSDVVTYGWDEDDRLVSVDRAGIHVEYRYDYQGRLVSKTVDGQETRYVWDGLDMIAEMDSAGNVVRRYIYGASINEVLVVTAGGTQYWGQQDGLGSVVGTTNDSGVVAATSSYDVYGNVRGGDLGPVPQRFTGMWWDKDAGLYYVRARWYDPLLGRFITRDPISTAGGLNLYSYAVNSPINFIDPMGEYILPWAPHLHYLVKAWQYARKAISEARQYFEQRYGIPADRRMPVYVPREWFWEHGAPSPRGQEYGVRVILPSYPLGSPPDTRSGWVWLRSAGGWYYAGGVCPTFVQLPPHVEATALRRTHLDVSQERLAGRITVPIEGALLRADIPIFGVAGGTNFKGYRVEYGEGTNPTEWHLIESSATPQPTTDIGVAAIPYMQGDVDIRGNLATWNTGLKNWVHLPWHPPEDPTDFNGVYTLRLVVTGKDGQTVEDRMTVEVGRAIAQALPGIALSPDRRVMMRFPEQSLTYPFRVYTILPLGDVGEEMPSPPEGAELIGPAYRIREPGDRFAKDVTLEFGPSTEELGRRDVSQVGIARYDVEAQEWLWLSTVHTAAEGGAVFSTTLTELPEPQAIYALVFDPRNAERSRPRAEEMLIPDPLTPVGDGVLVQDTFEEDTGYWKPRDRYVGAVVAQDNDATPDGSYALKLTNDSYSGNFSVTVLDRPFDVREYPVMSFDYRIPRGVKTDFYLQVNGRWYNLGFTDDPTDFRNRDVNIGNLGQLGGIVADDQWHSASVNLYRLLRQKTRHTQVDAIMMADWDVGGYMRLEFGHNARGATYYVDNFEIAAAPGGVASDVLTIDTFDAAGSANLVGGPSDVFSNPGTRYCEAAIADDDASEGNRALRLTYDASRDGAYCGYWTALLAANMEGMDELSLRLRVDGEMPPMFVGLRHAGSGIEAKVPLHPYTSAPDDGGWREAAIPLDVFVEQGLPDLSSLETLFVTFEHGISSGQGIAFLDDLRFCRWSGVEADIEPDDSIEHNFLLGGKFRTQESGAAAISAGYHKESLDTQAEPIETVRISYGGTIGSGYGGREFSYAIWEIDLLGIDARGSQSLVLKIRGENGGERPNIYLDDGTVRRPVRAKDFLALTTAWQEIYLPLEDYAAQGVDLSHLEALQVVFEWEEMSGTIYIAEIRLDNSAPGGVTSDSAQTEETPSNSASGEDTAPSSPGFPDATQRSQYVGIVAGMIAIAGVGLALYVVCRRRAGACEKTDLG